MRTFSKTATWSLIAFSVTAIIGWWLTGDPVKGGWIAIICRGIKIPAYYIHERMYSMWWPKVDIMTAPLHGFKRMAELVVEDYELESRRTEYMQTPTYVRPAW